MHVELGDLAYEVALIRAVTTGRKFSLSVLLPEDIVFFSFADRQGRWTVRPVRDPVQLHLGGVAV